MDSNQTVLHGRTINGDQHGPGDSLNNPDRPVNSSGNVVAHTLT